MTAAPGRRGALDSASPPRYPEGDADRDHGRGVPMLDPTETEKLEVFQVRRGADAPTQPRCVGVRIFTH